MFFGTQIFWEYSGPTVETGEAAPLPPAPTFTRSRAWIKRGGGRRSSPSLEFQVLLYIIPTKCDPPSCPPPRLLTLPSPDPRPLEFRFWFSFSTVFFCKDFTYPVVKLDRPVLKRSGSAHGPDWFWPRRASKLVIKYVKSYVVRGKDRQTDERTENDMSLKTILPHFKIG